MTPLLLYFYALFSLLYSPNNARRGAIFLIPLEEPRGPPVTSPGIVLIHAAAATCNAAMMGTLHLCEYGCACSYPIISPAFSPSVVSRVCRLFDSGGLTGTLPASLSALSNLEFL
jgi:hypothetical protein